jgi:hypothetical protein
MNERIKELMEKASSNACYDETKAITLYNKEIEAFAELIVKETMQVVANNLSFITYHDVADAVIEHFGIEE